MNDIIQSLSDEFKDICFVKGQRDGRYPYAHSMLIGDYLIDTGISSGFIRKLKRKVSINNVLLSHWHEDHISGNRLLPKAKFFCHIKDKPIIEDVQKMFEFYYVNDDPEQIKLFTTILESLRLKNIKVTEIIKDNDIIEVGDDYKIRVLHTPGHSAGHCCFYEINSKIAFLADIDLSSFGPWYAGIDSNLMEFEESIDKMLALDIDIAVTSHKGIIKGKNNVKEGLTKYKDITIKRDEIILSKLSEVKPLSPKDLANKNLIYKYYTEYELYEIMAEEIMIQLHFDKFLKNNLIEQKENGYILS